MTKNARIVLAAIATAILASCAELAAPHGDSPCSGYVDSTGLCHE